MLEQVRRDVDNRIAPLVGGIAEDLKLLFQQELALARSELRKQAQEAGAAGVAFGAGAVCALISGILLAVGLVLLLADLVPEVPVWGWFLIVAGAGGATGAFLLLRGRKRIQNVTLVPEKTIKSLKETVNA